MRFAKNDAVKATITLGVFLGVVLFVAVGLTNKPSASGEPGVIARGPATLCAGSLHGPAMSFDSGQLSIRMSAADSVRLSFAERFVELAAGSSRMSSNPNSPFYSEVLAGANLATLASIQSECGDLVLNALSTDRDINIVTSGRLTSSESLSTTGKLSLSASDLWLSGKVYAREVALNASNILNLEKDTQVALRDGANGGKLTANARVTFNGAQINAAGTTGGAVVFNSTNFLQYGSIDVGSTGVPARSTLTGRDAGPTTGRVEINFSGEFKQVEAAKISANYGAITLNGGTTATMYNSGTLNAESGSIKLFGKDLTLAAAHIDASGELGGGTVLIGGDYQGKGEAPTATKTTINSHAEIKADALKNGNGGKVIVWSNEATQFSGKISARGGKESGDGGFVEISSKDKLGHNGIVDSGADHGKAGTLLLDPHIVTISNAGGFFSGELIDPVPGAANQFGTVVVVLPNGNVAVRDHFDDFGGADAGAVHLYSGQTQALISSLMGSNPNDRVGLGGTVAIRVLDLNGNYVVTSPGWNGNRGAATWCSATAGINGAVSAANSLVGNAANAGVGNGDVLNLPNGNYVVRSSGWTDGVTVGLGAVTWGNGNTGTTGIVDATNSMVGGSANDQIAANGIVILNSSNYVLRSTFWDNPGTAAANAGAATWCSGSGPTAGVVSAANSIVGSSTNDNVGVITQLANGNFIVRSTSWDNGGAADAGAVTWGNGFTGTFGTVSAANSYIGTTAVDNVGAFFVTLSNGNCVIGSHTWDNTVAGAVDAGAATWLNGFTGGSGVISALNSLVGSTTGDFVGTDAGGGTGIHALTNGNYVVRSVRWDNAAVADAGAVTWADGNAGIVGTISALNSLVGATVNDRIGSVQLVTLNNGNYVVNSPDWDNGATANVGAATWGNGASGIVGAVSPANSLIGVTAGDAVGGAVISALANGNYVVRSSSWTLVGTGSVGAITWCNGSTGFVGVVDATNSMIGSNVGDGVGFSTAIPSAIMPNGSFAILSRFWNGGRGAVTWGNGTGPLVGTVSAANSLVGSTNGDLGGATSLGVLPNGNFIVTSSTWTNTATAASNAGMAAFGSQFTGISGVISNVNALVGTSTNDFVGSGATFLTNGNFVVNSSSWSGVGAATWCNGFTGTFGDVSAANSLVGSTAGDFIGNGTVALSNGNYVVASNLWDNGGIANAGVAVWGNGFTGTSGVISSSNAVVGGTDQDNVGTIFQVGNGDYLVLSNLYDDGANLDVGSVTYVNGTTGQTLNGSGIISVQNSIIGASDILTNASLQGYSSPTTGKFYVRFPNDGTGRVRMGLSTPGSASYSFDAGGNYNIHPSVLTNSLNAGTSVVLQANTAINIDSDIIVNNPNGNGGNLTLASGRSIRIGMPMSPVTITTDNGNLLIIGNDLLVNGVVDAFRDIGNAFINMNGTSVINAGTGIVTFDMRSGAGLTNNGAGQVVFTTVNAAAVNLNYSATTGNGLILDGSNFSGQVSINSNVARLNGGSGSFGGGLFINSGGRLSGNGTVVGNLFVNPGGFLAAGNSPGIIVVAGDMTLTGASTLDVEVDGTTAGAQYDQYQVTGNVTLGGATLNMILGYTPVPGDFYRIIDNQGANPVSGTFAGLPEGAVFNVGGYDFRITYVGGDSNDVVITVNNTAPTLANSTLAAVNEDTANPAGQTIFTIFNANFADADAGSSFAGIAITADASNGAQGVWQYSTDAAGNWFNVGAVSNNAALVIQNNAANTLLRFVPAADFNGAPGNLSVRAIDNTYTGGFTNGGATVFADTTLSGGTTSFSDPAASLSTTITAVNDEPTFTIPVSTTSSEDAGAQTVAGFATAISAGPADEAGQSLTFTVTVTGTTGTLAFSVAPAIDSTSGDLTYTATADTQGSAFVDVFLTDNGSNVAPNDNVSITQNFTIFVTNVNDAPVVTGNPALAAVNEDTANPPGALVSALVSGNVTDIDPTSSVAGIAVITNTANAVTEGAWQYSANLGANWFAIGVVANNNALVLEAGASDARVRFLPVANYFGVPPPITFRALDNTYGGGFSSTAGVEVRVTIDASVNGGTTAISGNAGNITTSITSVNDAPSFNLAPVSVQVDEDSGAASFANFATSITAGPANEAGQTLTFVLTLTGTTGSLTFSSAPAIDETTGELTFTPSLNTNGSADYSVQLTDNGSGVAPNVNTSAAQSFTITVDSVNDAPSFTLAGGPTVNEDAGAQTVLNFATSILAGPADEGGQTLTFNLTPNGTTGTLSFSSAPAINSGTGTLTFTASANTNGTATFDVVLVDNGPGIAPDVNTSATSSFTITVNALNDAPSFSIAGNPATINEDAGAQAVNGFATGMTAGPADEGGQTLTFNLTQTGGLLLFSATPAINPATGQLTYTTAANSNGTANFDVTLSDNGLTGGGNVNTSGTQSFTITVNAVNDPPSFTIPAAPPTVGEDAGAQSVAGFATSIQMGPVTAIDETTQTATFGLTLTGSTGTLAFSAAPAIAPNGTLTYTTSGNTFGTATYDARLTDNGGGADTSAPVSFTITVTAVNDPPFTVQPASIGVTEDVASPLTGFTINDVDSGAAVVRLTLAVSAGSLNAVTGGGVTVGGTPASRTLDGTTGAINVFVAGGNVTYLTVLNSTATATLTLTANDNGASGAGGVMTSAPANVSLVVAAVNDPPVITGPASHGVTEDIASFLSGFVVADVDSGALDVTLNFAAAAGTFSAVDNGGVTVTGSGTNSITLTGSTANITAFIGAANNLAYTTALNSTTNLNMTVTANDQGNTGSGGAQTDSETVLLVVTAVNDAPVTAAPASITVTEDVASNINGISFSDVDAGGASEDAVLSVTAGTLSATNSGGVTVAGSPGASITLSGTLANLNAFIAANRVTYTTALNSTTSQTLSLSIDDNGNTGAGGVQTSVLVNVTLNVTAINDMPTIVAPGSIAVIEDVASPITGITVTDVDSGANDVIATVQVTAGSLNAVTTGGVTVGGTPANRTLTGTVANINTYISGGNLTYTTVLNSTASQTLSIFVNDQGFTGLGGALTSLTSNVTLNVTAQNDAPIVAAPASITVVEDVASQITGISVSDVDAGAGSITLTLSVTSGTLAATSGGGVVVGGSGTANLTLTGTTTNVNNFVAAANAVMFTTALNSVSPVTLTSIASDNGNTPAPAQNSIAVNTTLNVTSINDPPTFNIPATSVTVLEDAGPSTVANFAQNILAGPPDEAGQTLTFTVAFVSSTGGLTFSTAPAINSTTGNLTFTPTANSNGSATYNVTLTDNGSNVPPNSNTSTTVSITINVTAVNDAPTFTIGTPPTIDEDAGAQTVANFATAMSVGPANESAQTFVSFNVSFVSGGLTFSTPPAISTATGNLTYTAAPNANGTATFNVTLTDSGSNVAPNVNTSIIHTFTITVTAVNDPPTFNIAGNPPAVAEDVPPQTVVGFATALSVGPANESAQTLVSYNFVLQATTGTLAFDSGPAISVATGDLTYAPTINTNGTATFSVTLTDSGSNVPPNINTSAPQFFTITVGAVNDAPVYDISGFSILNAIVEDDFTNPGTSVTAIIASGAGGNPITDVDVGAVEGLAVTFVDNTNGQWQYSLNGPGGPWTSFNPLTVQPNNATLLRSNGAQDRIRFVPNPNYFSDPPGLPTVAGTIQARAWDQTSGAPGGNADTTVNGGTTAFSINVETISITVDSVNDAPVIAGAGQTYLFHENNNFFNPIPVCDTVSASDLDLDNQFPAFFTIQIIPAPNGANEFLTATDTPPSVVATYFPGTHTLRLDGDGTGTWADFTTVLQSVRYSNFASPINVANRTIRITVDDGRGGQDQADNFITFNPAPIITLPIPDRTYTENALPLVFDSTATVTDNNANFSGGRLIVTLRTDDGTPGGNPTWLDSDRLWVVNQGTGTNQIRVTNSDVFFEGLTQIGTIDAVDNGQNATVATPPLLIVHLNANATPFRTQALVRAIAFDNSSDNPGTITRISEFVIWDGDALTYNGAISFPRIKQMFVVPVNDAPVYDNTGVTLFTTINEDDVTNLGDAIDALIASAGGDRITDVDNFAIEGIAVTFVDNGNGAWQYSLDNGVIWHDFPICANDSATLLSAVPADGDRIRFVPGLDFAGTATITFRAWDQTSGTRGLVGVDTTFNGSTSAFSIDIETATITVTTDNDAPVVTLPTADPTYVENAAEVYVDHFATVTDVDSADFDGGTLVADIISGANFGDALGFRSVGTGAGEILIDTNNVLYQGVPIGTWALSNSDRTLTVTFSGANATPDAAQGVLRHITFINTTENPLDNDRIVRFVVTDGDGGTSVQRIKRIFVVITNDTPIADAGPDQTYLNAGALTTVTLVGSGTVDPDGDSLKYRWEGDNNGPSVIRDNAGDPFVPSIPNETIQLPPGTYHYTLTVRDPSNRTSTDLVTIIVRPKYVSTPIPGSNITIPGTVVGTTSAPFTLVVENTSTSNLTITLPPGGPFSGTHPNEFSLSGAPVTIPSLGTANILLTCTPVALGTRLATLTLNTDDPTQPNVTYQLFCDSFGPGAKITSPLTVKGTLGVALSYTITATGQLPLTISVLSSVPPGMTVVGDTITGTPAASGFFGVTIQASNLVSTDTQFLTFSIVNPAPGSSNFPKFVSPPSVTANPILVNTQVTFSAFATDIDGDVLGYYWNFGDGSDSRLSEVAHTFTAPGRYDVQISVSDGEHIIGRHLYVTVVEQGEATFVVSKALINFDFKTPARSNVTIAGKLPIDNGVSLANASVTWQVGPSLTRTFTVNNGIGGDSLNLIKFKSAAVGATQYIATYQITMKGTTLFTELTDIGYKNTTVPSKPLTTFPVTFSITIDAGTPSVTTFDTSYVAVRNKYGKAKKIVLP